ncbi:MAG: PUA domain-containing protein [Thermoproteota archaeon]|nr:PUA domain-containing protein [Thermoproteota archaeon]
MDHSLKLKHTIDALYGTGMSKNIPKDVDFKFSKKTGRIRAVYHNDLLLFTPRSDGGIAMTMYCAELFSKNKKFINDYCIEVDAESKPFVEEGKSVFCQHVKKCGSKIKIGVDVPIFFKNKIIAVGKSVLSSDMIKTQSRGMAIRIRDSLKSQNGGEQLS